MDESREPIRKPAQTRARASSATRLERERTHVLFCEECGCDSEDDARGWESHLAREDDGSTTVVVFCPVCSVEV